jgi:hypothetical protein
MMIEQVIMYAICYAIQEIPLPLRSNPVDFFLDTITVDHHDPKGLAKTQETINMLCAAYSTSKYHEQVIREYDEARVLMNSFFC